jgi:hypothetical protein
VVEVEVEVEVDIEAEVEVELEVEVEVEVEAEVEVLVGSWEAPFEVLRGSRTVQEDLRGIQEAPGSPWKLESVIFAKSTIIAERG